MIIVMAGRLLFIVVGAIGAFVSYRELDNGTWLLSARKISDGLQAIAWGLIGTFSAGFLIVFAVFYR